MNESESGHPGDRLLLPCEGGHRSIAWSVSRPRVEIDERGGVYVLMDEGEPHDWRYLFVPDER